MGKIAKQTKPYSNIRNGWCKWNRYKMESQYPYPRRSYGHAEFFLRNVWSNACRDKPTEVIVMG